MTYDTTHLYRNNAEKLITDATTARKPLLMRIQVKVDLVEEAVDLVEGEGEVEVEEEVVVVVVEGVEGVEGEACLEE